MVDPPTYRADPDPEFADRLERVLLERLTASAGSVTPSHRDPDDPAGDVITLESEDGRRGQDRGPTRRRLPGRWLLVAAVSALVAVLGTLLVAPRDQDEQVPAGPPPAPGAEEVAAFCDEISDMGLEVSVGEGYEDLDAALVAAEEIAPAEIRAAVTTMADENRAQHAADPPPTDTPPDPASDEYFTAAAAVGDYMADHCGYQVIDVTATDHEFEGIPAEADRGKTLLRITNDGTEYHELILQRVHYAETRPIEEILALPDGGGDLLDWQGMAFTPPGHSNWTVVDLKVNRYAAMCFVPTGATTPDTLRTLQTDETTQRHHQRGMTAEIQVP